ncbi:MAG: acetoin catabolism protein X [Gammaproteobacteria bacterium]|nr:acetoin catabolism protein X [Gammaproteobacteria bacterium]
MKGPDPLIGIIANPVSARDIRRIVAHAGNMQITERANIVLRLLAGLGAVGIKRVLMMPENAGIRSHVMRALQRASNMGEAPFPQLDYLDMTVSSSSEDSIKAASMMSEAGVSAIIVLGGDGTHRAVVSSCGDTPIAGISTGTNNAFPRLQEPTSVGMAVGLAVIDSNLSSVAFRDNKILEVNVSGRQEIALVDVAIVSERYIGARALWKTQNFQELFVSFAETEVIGMSSVAGLLDPVGRDEEEGRRIRFDHSDNPRYQLKAPIAPGIIETIGIKSWDVLTPDIPYPLCVRQGSIAFDGERELSFSATDQPTVTLRTGIFRTIDVTACMKFGARSQLLRSGQNR